MSTDDQQANQENIAQTVARLLRDRDPIQHAIRTDEEYPDVVALPDSWRVNDLEKYMPRPRRNIVNRQLTTVDGFAGYVVAHALDNQTAIYIDRSKAVAVIDGINTKDKLPAWGDHQATLALETTPEWDAWVKQSGAMTQQRPFVDFIQDRAGEIVEPPLADLVQQLRDIQADGSSKRRDSSTHLSESRERSGSTTVTNNLPEFLDLSVPVLKCEPNERTQLRARLVVKLADEGVQFAVTLVNQAEVMDRRIREFVTRLNGKIGNQVPVYF